MTTLFAPTWTIILMTELTTEGRCSRSLSRIVETEAPGKQCVTALKRRIDLVNESPIIRVDGENKGGMEGDCELPAAPGGDGPAADCTGSTSAWSALIEAG